MKKEIFKNVTSIPEEIWRGNKKPNEEPKDKTTLEYKEYIFNDSSKYIKIFNDDQQKILNQFPEYLAHYIPIATNTGLMCFYNAETTTLVIYDLLEKESNLQLSSILPDISPMLSYDHIKTPMNVRQLNFNTFTINNEKKSYFISEHSYIKDGETYYFYNCDKIGNKLPDLNNNNYFKEVTDRVSEVEFEYKPLFVIRVFNSNGSRYTEEIEGLTKKENEAGIYYADISNQSSTDYFTLIAPSGSGYLEVL